MSSLSQLSNLRLLLAGISKTTDRASVLPLPLKVTPIEKWLELEAGVTPSFSRRSTEWATDFLLKKPWTLSSKVEFMVGIGPEWIHTRDSGMTKNAVGG